MIRLIAVDMDGTWLNDEKEYDYKLFINDMNIMEKNNVTFVIASGNQYGNLKQRFADVADRICYIAENGALIAKGNYILSITPLSTKAYTILLKLTHKYPYDCIMSGIDMGYIRKSDKVAFRKEAKNHFATLKLVNSFEEVHDKIIKFAFHGDRNDMTKLAKIISDNYPEVESFTSDPTYVDLVNKGMNKAVGLKQLAMELNIESNQIVAFGDGQNDEEMLKFAGYSIAPSNAIPEVKKLVDKVIGSNNDSSVQKEIINLLSSENK